ncbi:hypothetical protein DRW71_19855 [Salmonella enterica subsp. diarizonae]|nr:DUF551 domain-containing protein [Salmonella enterica]ECC9191933.1 hypothetical protein [Salmonella enterica subsp. diarizonae]EGL0767044.1 DUF551 domain-containing protein [Salmonella enterica subsp. enterica]EBE1335275.1 DUF551 domain-containing protein [Salmonella enterica]EBI1318271.1 DUF551 domain-containing protein [Salmonella enterica]
MTTITSKFTKERLIDWAVVAVAERGRDLKDAPESVEAAANLKLAEIALAALTAEPVAYNQVQRDMMKDIIVRKMGGNLAGEKLVMDDIHAVTMALIDAGFRTAPPVQETGVYKDMLNIIGLLENNEWAEHCTSTVLGSLLESEITRLVGKEQPVPVVPDEWITELCGEEFDDLSAGQGYRMGWNACRATMLNGDTFRENSISSTNNFREMAETSTNSPVIPDGWVSCSERMPEQGAYISAVSKHGEYVAGQVIDDWLDLHDGTSFGLDEVYLWMMLPPLPAPPQQ